MTLRTHLVPRALLLLLMLPAAAAAQTTFTVTVGPKTASNPYFNRGSDQTYYINGIEAQQLVLTRGQTYTFQMSNVPAFHPFYITTSDVGAGDGQWDEGVTGNLATGNQVLTFTPSAITPAILFYQCGAHQYMGWEISVQGTSGVRDDGGYRTASVTTTPNPTMSGAVATVALPKSANVIVTVHDVLGRAVATLYDGVIDGGSARQFAIDGGSLAPGLYEIRVSGADVLESTRMVVTR
jgi:hypothetical protein